MKLTCPECFSEFDVPDASIGTTGRRVRCNVCTRIWFQDPDIIETIPEPVSTDEHSDDASFTRFDDGMDFDPIPSSLHPAEDDDVSHDASHISKHHGRFNKTYVLRIISGFVVAAALFALFLWLGALAGLHKGALRGFYAPFGIVHTPAPLSIKVEDASATLNRNDEDGSTTTQITAILRNTGEESVDVPLIEVSLITVSGTRADAVYIKPETPTLDVDQTFPLQVTLPTAITPDESIRIRFIGH